LKPPAQRSEAGNLAFTHKIIDHNENSSVHALREPIFLVEIYEGTGL
jgi:hypothetical protein